jgi:hypothetical protein
MSTQKNNNNAARDAGQPEITVTINDETVRYYARQTDAPKDYDGFGTVELADFAGERLVLIREEHYQWQTARYSSGLHGTDETSQPISAVTGELWKKIARENASPRGSARDTIQKLVALVDHMRGQLNNSSRHDLYLEATEKLNQLDDAGAIG